MISDRRPLFSYTHSSVSVLKESNSENAFFAVCMYVCMASVYFQTLAALGTDRCRVISGVNLVGCSVKRGSGETRTQRESWLET